MASYISTFTSPRDAGMSHDRFPIGERLITLIVAPVGIPGKEGGGTFFRRLAVLHKNKLKSEIFDDKKSLQTKMFFCLN